MARLEAHGIEHHARLNGETEARGSQCRIAKVEEHTRAEGAVHGSKGPAATAETLEHARRNVWRQSSHLEDGRHGDL